ncbi:alpha-1,3-arabinosyltransferase XAT3-like [Tasmannia lanceolata]|uniref:alpha-1,3-arabinosyltransferase XAT3-like n=1 Tax=Tasmannia lanceolata TaxID=3420 RepID=UPI004064B516
MALRHDMKFVKSFSRYEPAKLGYGALVGCLLISLGFLVLFKPYLSPLPISNLRSSMRAGLSMLIIENTGSSQRIESKNLQEQKTKCNLSDPRSDLCEIEGDIRIHGNSSMVFVASSEMGILARNESWKIRPYARKGDLFAMSAVKELSIKSLIGHEEAPNCTLNHNVPAVIFSIGGYTGNLFHDFTDVLIPLFITSRQFNGEVQFLITDYKPWWIIKYNPILKQLSRYEILDFDRDDRVHCFKSAVIGLRCHKELSIDPSKSPNGYSMYDFNEFLRNSYSLERAAPIQIGDGLGKKPRLLIISRKKSRSFTNEGEIVETAKSLGYEVVVAEAGVSSDLSKFAQIVNSCDVMMGVHGAGLTNLVFLPINAILIQIVPFGGLEWLSRTDFGKPAVDMKLRYLEYKIKMEESSLIKQYPRNHVVLRDPLSIHKQGWLALRSIYLDKQNVMLDVGRLRAILLKALELLHH